eukprot:CAMPEP_0113940120 /NCGR_PEP_ID=MMETSP1339-20121228/6302_1 /TAXON_ID=94617 /ORGANISM="Fibrocapsa japonica" /LENGTH=241 /DNA_ID=CAMNT_0000943823 /DNA_START=75 /DNA_END=800 /DNA_ORIENTATION=- /assembly_acc=CAM_ASM_000762
MAPTFGLARIFFAGWVMISSFCSAFVQFHGITSKSAVCNGLKMSATTTASVSRREALCTLAAGGAILATGVLSPKPASAAIDLDSIRSTQDATVQYRSIATDEDVKASKFVTLPSGVRYADIKVGTGDLVQEGSLVSIQWALRRQNGYFVDSSQVSNFDPFIFRVGTTGPRSAVKGVDEAVRGMRKGGIRRLTVPPELGYVEGCGKGKPGPMPVGFGPQRQVNNRATTELFVFEIEVQNVR